ncbi:sce7725 family protein [Lacinutrix iliipiscaria]|uniref:Sce7725 family protein n=1 Tax=Lacinutrix iliipiscaria TaxID=1230532 RepID=A0ABW5WLR3_9FLAO
MYFPFLRGKQFELIALREIAGVLSGSNTINPIIEPVKKKTSTYIKTIDLLQKANVNFTIVINPSVGDKIRDIDYICANLLPPLAYENFQIGIIVRSQTNMVAITNKLKELGLSQHPIVLILGTILDESFDALIDFIKTHTVAHILTSPKMSGRRKFLRELRKVNDNLIFLSDTFTRQLRNKDYLSDVDEFFSDEHIYYPEDGYKGYSDFLTVGKDYSESGFSPYAVAIHLTYFNAENEFRIHHFVSESNEDTSDVAGKFAEAIEKLIPFINDNDMYTNASNEFRKLYDDGKYPGLGTVKKLSILNHLELVHDYFSKK